MYISQWLLRAHLSTKIRSGEDARERKREKLEFVSVVKYLAVARHKSVYTVLRKKERIKELYDSGDRCHTIQRIRESKFLKLMKL